MTDISKCPNEQCHMKYTCWRYLAPASEWQSYSNFSPKPDGTCEFHIKVKQVRDNDEKRD